jgi:hypothetical protein
MLSHNDITLVQNVFLGVVNMRQHKYLAILVKLGVIFFFGTYEKN